MNEAQPLRVETAFRGAEDTGTKVLMFGISALLHAVVFLLLISLPSFRPQRELPFSAITVSLVSLPGPGGGGEMAPAAEPAPAPEPVPEPAPVEAPPEPAAPEAVSLPPEPPEPEVSIATEKPPLPVMRSQKKKTKTDRRLEVDKTPEKKPPPKPAAPKPVERSDSVSSAIAALRKQVGTQETAGGTGGGGGGAGGGPRGVTLMDIYRSEVAVTVQRNWAFSEQLGGVSRNLKSQLTFKVMPNGQITDIQYYEKSGNRYLDESAWKAIMKSNPVAPHPEGIRRPYVEVGLTFTSAGVR
jgi:colicin import membrane protein